MKVTAVLGAALIAFAPAAFAVETTSGTPVHTGAKAFPTSHFSSMYYMPKNMEQEPRPVIPRLNGGNYPDSLNNPRDLPTAPPSSETLMPSPVSGSGDLDSLISDVWDIAHQLFRIDKGSSPTCNLCRTGLSTLQKIAHIDPDVIPGLATSICESFNLFGIMGLAQECAYTLQASVYGGPLTQVLSYANLTGAAPDAQGICAQIPALHLCDHPEETLSSSFLDDWFHGSRHPPKDVVQHWENKRAKAYGSSYDASKNLRAAHLSDLHLDGRYFVGGESDCTYGSTVQCCRVNSYNSSKFHGQFVNHPLPDNEISHKANYWGSLPCDAPWSLMMNSMETLKALGGDKGYDLALVTGDLVAHDDLYRYSRDFVRYSEQAMYDVLKAYLGKTPVLPTLGNHDTTPENFMAPAAPLPDNTAHKWDWDLNYVAELWKRHSWIDDEQAQNIRTHHGGFSMSPRKGLRVISLNTDFWYYVNFFNYIHMSNPDVSGMMRFLTDELFAAEKARERVWIIGHVLTGWSGTEALDKPTNLFYQIVSRFAPHTIAAIFFGHTHEDQFQVFYFNDNGAAHTAHQTTPHAVSVAYVAPSITPYKNFNPTFRVYDVHPDTYDIMDFHQYYTPVVTFDDLIKSNANHGPVWRELYTARELYSDFHASKKAGTYKAGVKLDGTHWPQNAPLNGTFWSALTDEMEQRPSLVTTFSEVQSRNSPTARQCTEDDCIKANICYMRAGSATLGRKCNSQWESTGR